MTPEWIKAKLTSLEQVLADKGYYMPKASYYVNWIGYDITINIEYRVSAGDSVKNIFIHAPFEIGNEGCFKESAQRVNNIESIQDAQRSSFLKSISDLIEMGREIGVDVDYLNPLTEMMKKLSSNVITHQK